MIVQRKCNIYIYYTYTHTYIYIHAYTHVHVYTVVYYSATKKNEILPFATTRVDLEGIMLSEMSQTEKDKYCMFSFICET